MSFREYLCSILEETKLFAMAFSKKECEKRIIGLEPQINLHLIKILAFKDETNFKKHINDIMNWLEGIQDLDFNKKGNKFSKDFYFHLLCTGPITDDSNIKYISDKFKRKLKDYLNLPRIRTDDEIVKQLFKIHREISKLLSEDSIYDIEDYLLNINKKD